MTWMLLLAIHGVPVRHSIRVRTTTNLARSFEEERRRTKVVPRLTDEKLRSSSCSPP
jgi:hypothetical protein